MTPEISHRCPACGVAVRGTSLFCPQCGRPLKTGAAAGNDKAETTETPPRAQSDGRVDTSIITSSNATAPDTTAPDTPRAKEPSQANVAGENRSSVAATAPLLAGDERSRRQRVAPPAREKAEGKIAPRVEKLRHASGAMLEEASYDPSLRFVLVAVAIFLLSLLLLLLNHLLG